MRNIWVISDTHFGHANIIKYCGRPFSSVDEMNHVLVENWNKVVRDEDIVYHLGDVYFGKNWSGETPRDFLRSLRGRKRLILGNHDSGLDQNIRDVFQKILVWRQFPEFGLLLTHVPVHPNTLSEKWPVNVHGHIHNNERDYGKQYKNVSVEVINYTPVNIEELRVK